MYKSLKHLLTESFDVSERLLTGFSNTAAIMRLGEQCGASASTSPEDLSIQEQLTQAVWCLSVVEKSLCSTLKSLIVCKYGSGSRHYRLALDLLRVEYGNQKVQDYFDDLASILFENHPSRLMYVHGGKNGTHPYPSTLMISNKHELGNSTVRRHIDILEKDIYPDICKAEVILTNQFKKLGLLI